MSEAERSEAAKRTVLDQLDAIASEMSAAWDADEDMRVGKMLGALAGRTGYRRDIDQLREDIARLDKRAQGEITVEDIYRVERSAVERQLGHKIKTLAPWGDK